MRSNNLLTYAYVNSKNLPKMTLANHMYSISSCIYLSEIEFL